MRSCNKLPNILLRFTFNSTGVEINYKTLNFYTTTCPVLKALKAGPSVLRNYKIDTQSWKKTRLTPGPLTSFYRTENRNVGLSESLKDIFSFKEKWPNSERNHAGNWVKTEIDLCVFTAALKDVIYRPFEMTHEKSSQIVAIDTRSSSVELYV